MCTPMHLIIPPALIPSTSRTSGALYLGSMLAVHEPDALRINNITHLVQVLDAPWHPFSDKAGYNTYKIDIIDQSTADLKPHLEAVCNHIDSVLLSGKSILVHCQQVRRTAALPYQC